MGHVLALLDVLWKCLNRRMTSLEGNVNEGGIIRTFLCVSLHKVNGVCCNFSRRVTWIYKIFKCVWVCCRTCPVKRSHFTIRKAIAEMPGSCVKHPDKLIKPI